MEYFAGLDISMDETHVCVVDRDGAVVYEGKSASTAEAIANELAKAPSCRRIARDRTHGADPVPWIGGNSAFRWSASKAGRPIRRSNRSPTHKTDRNDARGLAHLARTGFFKPVALKSLSAHAVRSMIIARKKLVGQRVTLENQIRGLAVVFGVRLPRALRPRSSIRLSGPARGWPVFPPPCGA